MDAEFPYLARLIYNVTCILLVNSPAHCNLNSGQAIYMALVDAEFPYLVRKTPHYITCTLPSDSPAHCSLNGGQTS